MRNTIQTFSNSEVLTLNALDQLEKQNINVNLDPHTFKLINAVVWNVCKQLEQTEELKKYDIKINN
jgi:Fe2+ transport system protein B